MNPEHRHDLTRLLEKVKGGDENAFRAFYEEMAGSLYSLVFRILEDAREAEDVVQEGFLHVWKQARSYDSQRSSPSTWAFMIFRHKAIDRLRSRERRGRGLEKLSAEPNYAPTSCVEQGVEGVEQSEEAQAVREAIGKVPDDQREVLELAFFKGLTHAEIASRLQAPMGTVKARIRRGLLKMGEILRRSL